MQAIVRRKKGLMLSIPKDGLYPMLLMEWLGLSGVRLTEIKDNKDRHSFDMRLDGDFGKYHEAQDYINANVG